MDMEKNTIIRNFHTYWGRPLIASTIFFVVIFSFFVTIFGISDGDPVPDDEYFHFRYAELLRTQGWNVVQKFDWIYLTSSGEDGIRYAVNLYHVSLIPFTYFDDQLFGMHVAIAFYMSLVIAIVYYILRKERVQNPLFFTLLLLTSSYFIARFLLGRSFVLMTGLIFLEMYCAIHRKYVPLFFVALLHVLWHQTTFFLPLIIVGIAEIARYVAHEKCDGKTIMTTAGATVVGMMFFPGFPGSLFSWLQWIFVIQGGDASATSGSLSGAELATKDFMTYFVGQEFVFFVFVVCVTSVIFIYIARKKDGVLVHVKDAHRFQWLYTLFIFLLVVTYGATAVSGRFFDFVLLTLVLLFAFVVTILRESGMFTINVQFHKWIVAICWMWLLVLCANTMIYMYAKSNTYDYTPARAAAQWISDHSDGREKVYLHNWGNFSLMFFGNTKNVYSTGIEPAALKGYDKTLYWKYYNMLAHSAYCEGEGDCGDVLDKAMVQMENKDPSYKEKFSKNNSKKVINSIRNDFDAKFIVSDSQKFDDVILASPELIDTWYHVDSEKFSGPHMSFTVFKLK